MAQSEQERKLHEHEHKLSLLEQWKKHLEEARHEDRLSRLERLAIKVTYTAMGALVLFALESAGLRNLLKEILR